MALNCLLCPGAGLAPRNVGLIRSLSAVRRDPSQSCHAVSLARAGTDKRHPAKEAAPPMLADKVDHIIGVDTHKDSHTVALVSPAGAVIAHQSVPANTTGYCCGYRFAVEQAPGRRVWAIEGTGSYGPRLTAYLFEQGEWVVEIDRPARPARRNGQDR